MNSSLVCAAESNNLEMCNLLIENGADKDCLSKDGRTPLMEAARHGYVQILEFLVEKGVDVNKASLSNDATPLSLSCLYGQSDATKFLLDHGADPEHILKDNATCIIEASRNGSTECARLLLDYIGSNGTSNRLATVVSALELHFINNLGQA